MLDLRRQSRRNLFGVGALISQGILSWGQIAVRPATPDAATISLISDVKALSSEFAADCLLRFATGLTFFVKPSIWRRAQRIRFASGRCQAPTPTPVMGVSPMVSIYG